MEFKYTPGPWKWDNEHYQGLSSECGQEILTHASYENMWLSFVENREGNARLIAAAPELLKALQGLMREWDTPQEYLDSAIAARKAIQKALEGSTTNLN